VIERRLHEFSGRPHGGGPELEAGGRARDDSPVILRGGGKSFRAASAGPNSMIRGPHIMAGDLVGVGRPVSNAGGHCGAHGQEIEAQR